MRKASRKKNKALREFHQFNQQAVSGGGLMELYSIHRGEGGSLAVASLTDRRAEILTEALIDVISRWRREGGGKLCLTCDNAVDQLDDIAAFAFITTEHVVDEKGVMSCPLCYPCAARPGLEAIVMDALKQMACHNLRKAPPFHMEAGHA